MRRHPPEDLCDSHCHSSGSLPLGGLAVLNGTSPDDWPEVMRLSENSAAIIPAIGLHPWRVSDAPEGWRASFLDALDHGANAIGEIGLDRHFAADSFEAQCAAFSWQMEQAAERNLPVSIHCLKATDRLLHLLRENERPARGVHLHAYCGSAKEAEQFAELGAYFSFHAGQLQVPARKAPDTLRIIPLDRLLIETDAPDRLPNAMDHATYLQTGYEQAAKIREMPLSELIDQVRANFESAFF